MSDERKRPPSQKWMVFVLFMGVLLPAATVVVEMATRLCSSVFFDPMPTMWHVVLLGIVPLSNAVVLGMYLMGNPRQMRLLTFAVGVAIGTGFIYSIQFLLLAPFSVLGLIAYGMGLLGLSPFLALASSIICAGHMGQWPPINQRRHARTLWSGVLSATTVLAVFVLITYATNAGIEMAGSSDEAEAGRGVRLVRMLGSEEVLLRACYELPTAVLFNPFSLPFGFNPKARRAARSTYYRVTGRSFNSVPPPKLIGFRAERTSDFDFDSDVGGTAVNSRTSGLSMSASRLDARVDPDALTAYTEWTIVFANSSSMDREARAEVALPPGGVVSRLTLWVDGEEREAAFSARGKVRAAYKEVAVVQRRDPVLVTSCGPDRVLMQCFPVPAGGGTMKVRVGITSPLMPEDYATARYLLPHFIERNFGTSRDMEHSVYIESKNEMSVEDRTIRPIVDGHSIQVALPDGKMSGTQAVLCKRNAGIRRLWTPDRLQPRRYAIVESLAESAAPSPKRLILVIDGSAMLRDARRDIADALGSLPDDCRLTVISAQDKVEKLLPEQPATLAAVRTARDKVLRMDFAGGIDNRAALLRACRMAMTGEEATILWIHGPQPLTSDRRTEELLQLWERRPDRIRILSFSASDGRNSILADLERTGAVEVVARRGSIAQDLLMLFGQWESGTRQPPVTRLERVPLASIGNAVRASTHLCRLWASGEVMRICRTADSRRLPEAAELAARNQLVTPVSGAVVLESAAQYAQAGLKPVDPKSVPSVTPEPAGWLILALGVSALLIAARHRRRREPALRLVH